MTSPNTLNKIISGNLNASDLLTLINGRNSAFNIKNQITNMIFDNAVQILISECPSNISTQAFVEDPRRSDKEKALATILNQAIPSILSKMSEPDVSFIYTKFKNRNEVLNEQVEK